MFRLAITAFALISASPLSANAWEKNFNRWLEEGNYILSERDPEVISSVGNIEADIEAMYRAGYVPVGVSHFESKNSKTRDAVRWAKEIGAAYLIVLTDLQSSRTGAIPWTSPTSSTTVSNGTASVFGSGGSATGTYSGSSTTYGSQTTYLPFTINTYTKVAIYFVEEPKIGVGIYARQLTDAEVTRLETRRSLAVRFVRDGSPAYLADILPNDIILEINGKPADPQNWWIEILDENPDTLKIDRAGKIRELDLVVPPEWRTVP